MARTISGSVYSAMQEFLDSRHKTGVLSEEDIKALFIPEINVGGKPVVYAPKEIGNLTKLFNQCTRLSDYTPFLEALRHKDAAYRGNTRTDSFKNHFTSITGSSSEKNSYQEIAHAFDPGLFGTRGRIYGRVKDIRADDMLQMLTSAAHVERRFGETATMRANFKNIQKSVEASSFPGPKERNTEVIDKMINDKAAAHLEAVGVNMDAFKTAIRGAMVESVRQEWATPAYYRAGREDSHLTLQGIECVDVAAKQTYSVLAAPLVKRVLGIPGEKTIDPTLGNPHDRYVAGLLQQEGDSNPAMAIERITAFAGVIDQIFGQEETKTFIDASNITPQQEGLSKEGQLKAEFIEACVQQGAFGATSMEEFLRLATRASLAVDFRNEATKQPSAAVKTQTSDGQEVTMPVFHTLVVTDNDIHVTQVVGDHPADISEEQAKAVISSITKVDFTFDAEACSKANLHYSKNPLTEALNSKFQTLKAEKAQEYLTDVVLEEPINEIPDTTGAAPTTPALYRDLPIYKQYRQAAAAKYEKYSKFMPVVLTISPEAYMARAQQQAQQQGDQQQGDQQQGDQQQGDQQGQQVDEQYAQDVAAKLEAIAKENGSFIAKKESFEAENGPIDESFLGREDVANIILERTQKEDVLKNLVAGDPEKAKALAAQLQQEHEQAAAESENPETFESEKGFMAAYISSAIKVTELEAQIAEAEDATELAENKQAEEQLMAEVMDKYTKLKGLVPEQDQDQDEDNVQ